MNTSHPKVSVIVPNYNHARYLKERIDSILRQDYQDFELILLDDASTDGSDKVLRAYAGNPHVAAVEINGQNTASPFKQWLKGIGLARGEYVWIAESDDVANPKFLSTLVRILDAHPQVTVAFSGSVLIDGEGNELPEDMNHWKTRGRKYAVFDGRKYARHNLYWRGYIANASSALFRKGLLGAVDVSPCASMRYAGDWLFWSYLSLTGDVAEVYSLLNYFRQHAGKVTIEGQRTGDVLREDMLVLAEIEARLDGLGWYKKTVRHGLLYSRIRKLPFGREEKAPLYARLRETLHSGRGAFLVERVNRYLRFVLPFLPTMKHDRIYPKR